MHTLPLLLVLALLLAVPPIHGDAAAARHTAPPPPVGPLTVEAEEIAYDPATNTVTARGGVRMTHPQFTLFADAVTVDLRGQVVTAEGRVRLIDTAQHELRGVRVVYDITRGEATVSRGETIIDRVYISAARLQGTATRLTVEEATVTPCDPARPLYRVTARRLEITPGRELVAHQASLWLGSVRIVTLGRYRMSLAPQDPRAPRLPGVGVNPTDGIWVDYRINYAFGDLGGELHAKYGQISGLFLLNTLAYDRPAWRLALDAGRTQREDPDRVIHALTQVELSTTFKPWPVPGTPLRVSARAAAGWFDELDSLVATTRVEGLLTLSTEAIPLGAGLDGWAALSYRYSAYGSGQRRGIAAGAVAVTRRLNEVTALTARYDLATVSGSTPFFFDSVAATSTVTLAAEHLRPDFRASAAVSHDFAIALTKLSAGVGFRVSPSFFFDVAGVYNLTTRAFEDLDYTLAYRCDCVTVEVRYRQIRQEISLNVTLGVSDRLRFLSPAP